MLWLQAVLICGSNDHSRLSPLDLTAWRSCVLCLVSSAPATKQSSVARACL